MHNTLTWCTIPTMLMQLSTRESRAGPLRFWMEWFLQKRLTLRTDNPRVTVGNRCLRLHAISSSVCPSSIHRCSSYITAGSVLQIDSMAWPHAHNFLSRAVFRFRVQRITHARTSSVLLLWNLRLTRHVCCTKWQLVVSGVQKHHKD